MSPSTVSPSSSTEHKCTFLKETKILVGKEWRLNRGRALWIYEAIIGLK